MTKFLIAIGFLLVFNIIANLAAQAIMPTRQGDSAGRRFGYRILTIAMFAVSLGITVLGIALWEGHRF